MANPTAEKITENVREAGSTVRSDLRERFPNVRRRAADLGNRVEERAAKIPESGFIAAAGLSIIASAVLAATSREKPMANFVGLWAPSLLLMGIYTKLVKMERRERY